jgi:hypothetical protein
MALLGKSEELLYLFQATLQKVQQELDRKNF